MGQPVDKLVVLNGRALEAKHGPEGLAAIQAALGKLAAADAALGLRTASLDISDAKAMVAIGGRSVTGPRDEAGAKAAVDAAAGAHQPDYILLLGGPDLVPHILLRPIPGWVDEDKVIPSDLPYASPAPMSRSAARFLTVTRVVGRLAAPVGSRDPQRLIELLEAAASRTSQAREAFLPPFAISAADWHAGTLAAVQFAFGGPGEVWPSPPSGHTAIDGDLARLAHFINCHGRSGRPEFYGDARGASVALVSDRLAAHVRPGTVVAAECCYGAEIYDDGALGHGEPICTTYLARGAAGFLGSTNISVGSDAGDGLADVMAREFMSRVLKGASLGRALLEARQAFVRDQCLGDPLALKTLAQFLLLGDPSWEPSHDPASGDHYFVLVEKSALRRTRRERLEAEGQAIGAAALRPGRQVALTEGLAQALAALDAGDPASFQVLSVAPPEGADAAARAEAARRRIAIWTELAPEDEGRRLTVVHLLDERVVDVRRLQTR